MDNRIDPNKWGLGMAAVVGGGIGAYLFGRVFTKREVPMAMVEEYAPHVYYAFVEHLQAIHAGDFKRARRRMIAGEVIFDTHIFRYLVEELPEALVLRTPATTEAWDLDGVHVATSPSAILKYAHDCIALAADALEHGEKHWPQAVSEGKYAAGSLRILGDVVQRAIEKATGASALRRSRYR